MIAIEVFQELTPALLDCLRQLVEIESPSTDKAAVDRVGAFIAAAARQLGAEIVVDRQTQVGDNLLARWGGSAEQNGILLLCHMDTVFDVGTLAQRPTGVEDGRFYGPGALDMKAGIAIALGALSMLRQKDAWPSRPITLLCTSDEETGSYHSRQIIESEARRADLALCLEPALPDGALKTSRKGTGDIEITAYGVAAHAGGDHDRGRNAIEELSYHIIAAQKLTDYDRGTTVSVGKTRGGTRSNVVPDEAWAIADLRVMDLAEVERVRRWAETLQPILDGARVSATVSVNRPPMPRDDLMAATFGRVQAIGQRLGLTLKEGSAGGASDANFIAPLGVPVMDGLGGVGEGAHAENEYVLVSSLAERAALLAAILTEW